MPASEQEGQEGPERLGLDIATQLDVPLVVLDREMALAWANHEARASGGPVWDALLDASRSRTDPALHRDLQALVLACLRKQCLAEALLETRDGTWFARAAPLQGHAGLVLIRLNAMHRLAHGGRERLRRLFGLTAAEAEIAAQLADGGSLESIAAARRVSVGTVRAQVRSVFRKTGTHRQGELIWTVGRLNGG